MKAAIATVLGALVALALLSIPTMSPTDYCRALGVSQHEIATNSGCR